MENGLKPIKFNQKSVTSSLSNERLFYFHIIEDICLYTFSSFIYTRAYTRTLQTGRVSKNSTIKDSTEDKIGKQIA